MKHYVYMIENKSNGKKYIGKRSCKCAICDDKYMGSGKELKKDIKKYGLKRFEKTILRTFKTSKEALQYEDKLIKSLNASDSDLFYNIKDGFNMTEKQKSNLSKLNSNKVINGVKIVHPMVEAKYKKVICVNNGMIFDSIMEAGEFAGLKGKHSCWDVGKCCRGMRKSAGKINGEKAKWMYLEEYNKGV